jgi:hypothetical protein
VSAKTELLPAFGPKGLKNDGLCHFWGKKAGSEAQSFFGNLNASY